MNHSDFMYRCLELAQKGRGLVGNGALVGSVLVRDEKIIAEGYYKGPGTDHAEANMIKNCEQEIRQEDGLFVNLEPCCHTGKTPPCTDLIIESGIKHVFYGMTDPDERVSGQGIDQLRSNGVEVIGPVLRSSCERLNRGYVCLRKNGRPYITLKKAQTIEGKVANDDGTKLCITSDNQNTWSHQHLRGTHDAILVGVQTVIIDDPLLTNRVSEHQPKKIIFDPDLRMPKDAQCIGEDLIIIRKGAEDAEESEDAEELMTKGVTILSVPMIDNHFNWDELWKALTTYHVPPSTILVEGGPATWDIFKNAGYVDEEVILIG